MSKEKDWKNGQIFIYLHKEGDENMHTVGGRLEDRKNITNQKKQN